MLRKILFSLITVVFFGCGTSRINDSDQVGGSVVLEVDFRAFLQENGLDAKDYSSILVIPSVGCGGCITQGEQYFFENADAMDKLFIFTMIQDLKLFKQSHIWAYSSQGNVLIDEGNMMRRIGFYAEMPCFVEYTGDAKLNISTM